MVVATGHGYAQVDGSHTIQSVAVVGEKGVSTQMSQSGITLAYNPACHSGLHNKAIGQNHDVHEICPLAATNALIEAGSCLDIPFKHHDCTHIACYATSQLRQEEGGRAGRQCSPRQGVTRYCAQQLCGWQACGGE